MKLLVVTQKLDKEDSYFGFFHSWIELLARECSEVTVLALEVHSYDLPENVHVYSLGKEQGVSRYDYLKRLWTYSWTLRQHYEYVVCHMSPLYVIAGCALWKLLHKKIALWYVHRSVDMKLRIAEILADVIFTASPESFQIKSTKVHFMRQAVDVAQFQRTTPYPPYDNESLHIVSVGRITAIKNLDVLITAASLLQVQNIPVRISLVGAAITKEDSVYEKRLRTMVQELDLAQIVVFRGSIPFKDIRALYWDSDASVNLAPRGGMDKTVLESFAAGTPVFLSNTAFASLIRGYEDQLLFPERDAAALADRIAAFRQNTIRGELAETLAGRVSCEYGLETLLHSLVDILGRSTR